MLVAAAAGWTELQPENLDVGPRFMHGSVSRNETLSIFTNRRNGEKYKLDKLTFKFNAEVEASAPSHVLASNCGRHSKVLIQAKGVGTACTRAELTCARKS